MRQFAPEKDLHFIRKNSHEQNTLQEVKGILNNDKIDFLYIDGDHTYEGVKSDFKMYSDFVADGGIVAFHDIIPSPSDNRIEVNEFWNELKEQYGQTKEIVADPNQGFGGIGVLYT